MDVWKPLAIILAILLVAGVAVTYEDTGSTDSDSTTSPTDTACTDGDDNDGDGYTDGDDPGCTKPYDEDSSEASVYDLDASWIFADKDASNINNDGATAFYGSKAVNISGSASKDQRDSDNSIREAYIQNSGPSWGGGSIKYTDPISITNGAVTTIGDNFYELIDIPRKNGDNVDTTCGNSIQENHENNFNCPEDYGMADDWYTTKNDSSHGGSNTITDELGSIGGETVEYIDTSGESSGNNIIYKEWGTSGNENPTSIDITDESRTSDYTIDPGDTSCSNGPDFFVEPDDNDQLKRVDCRPGDGSTATQDVNTLLTTKTDYDTPSDDTYKEYESAGTKSVCTGSNENASCSGSVSKCWDPETDSDHVDEVQTTEETYTETGLSSEVWWTEQNNPDYSLNSNSYGWSLDVTRDVPDGTNRIDYDGACADSSSKDDECDKDNDDGSCTFSDKTYYEKDTKYYAEDYDTHTVDVNIERIQSKPWDESQVFDTNDDETSEDAINVLFNNDYTRTVSHNSHNGRGYYQVEISSDGKALGNDKAVSSSRFFIDIDTGDLKFKSRRDYFDTWDADGSNGQGDGFIAILDCKGEMDCTGKSIENSTVDFLDTELEQGSATSFVDVSDVYGFPGCSSSLTHCLSATDVSLQNLDQWSDPTDPNTGLAFTFGENMNQQSYSTNQSLGTCEMYQKIDPDADLQSNYDSDPDGPTSEDARCIGDEQPNVCMPGDAGCECQDPNGCIQGDFKVYMEGPEVDESAVKENPGHFEIQANYLSSCNLRGNEVREGHVADVATPEYQDYEENRHSSDWEVCLDINQQTIGGTGDDERGDEADWDKDGSDEELGGEWYDLDSETAQQYLRTNGNYFVSDSNSIDSDGNGVYDEHDIDWYWRQNRNPLDSNYNPEGESSGTALEDDCGNPRFDSINCNDAGSSLNRQPTFYSFFNEDKRDEDFHPQGEDSSGSSFFNGYINKIQDKSNQLEPGMDTDTYNMESSTDTLPGSITIWEDSRGGENYADQYAITKNLSWSISSRGTPYPPYSTYYRPGINQRLDSDSSSVKKIDKVFGNSYAAVAAQGLDGSQDDNNVNIEEGDGVWIDPDSLRDAWHQEDGSGNPYYKWPSDANNWTDEFEFKVDLTGPDAGVGFDLGSGSGIEYKGSSGTDKAVMWGNIYWEGERSGSIHDRLETPMCGDDRREFLIEEVGESINSERYDGEYACASRRDQCFTTTPYKQLIGTGEHHQTGEIWEDVGRLKQDKEYCAQRPQDNFAVWWDQDYGDTDGDGLQDTCDTNSLYGKSGVRWFDEDYVMSHPHAVKGGIDDSWNAYMIQRSEFSGLESRPEKDNWQSSDFSSMTPVDTGTNLSQVATLGFCGGDDEGEYMVAQQCNTDLCETNTSVLGVAKNPDSCVIDEETMSYDTDVDERTVFKPGSEITVDLGQESRKMICFSNNWFDDYPIIFNQQDVEVPFGESATAAFHVINVRDSSTTFEVEMIDPFTDDPSAYQYSTFVSESGDTFETTISPQSSETFYVNIEGSNKAIGDDSKPSEDDLTVRASAVNSDMSGQDYTTVEVVNNTATNSTVGTSEPQSVPGIGAVHIMVLVLMSSAIFFLQS